MGPNAVQKLLIVAMGAGALIWIVHLVVEFLRRRQQLRVAAEFQSKLLDRVTSAREFGEVLNSPAGRQLLDSLVTEKEISPRSRIVRVVQIGVLLIVIGLGLVFTVGLVEQPLRAEGWFATMALFALVTLATGIGLLLSARVSYSVAKRLGLASSDPTAQPPSTAHTPGTGTPSV